VALPTLLVRRAGVAEIAAVREDELDPAVRARTHAVDHQVVDERVALGDLVLPAREEDVGEVVPRPAVAHGLDGEDGGLRAGGGRQEGQRDGEGRDEGGREAHGTAPGRGRGF
jgi:hypothetical protein